MTHMYDFSLLNDFEFEKLSADILSKKLGVELRYFKPGRDGGIDLKDDAVPHNIIVQVKHYSKSSFSSLFTSLKKEVDKVNELNPNSYYVCVSTDLTADNVKDIYELFSDYMKDTSHIITKSQLVSFLNEEENQAILRKNFKLWLLADKVLKEIFNTDVFLDGEVLLTDIEEDLKFFVQTNIFNEALVSLNESKTLILIGSPGVGKSINSKMIAAAFVRNQYKIRYTSDSRVDKIKKVISENRDVKEVIFIDDFLGQYYFDLKSGQDRELISLIKYVSTHKNKVLIMNSRVTILQEAKRILKSLDSILETEQIKVKIIDMESVTLEEKALIFLNHLRKENLPSDYMEAVKSEKSYKRIVEHPNFNPRIIEFVTLKKRYEQVLPDEYVDYIISNLTDPKEVWEDEFIDKLVDLDRIFMYTLFSLTDTFIDEHILKECFESRLKKEGKINNTVSQFSLVKSRLMNSLIKLYSIEGKILIGVINPSLNDYLNNQVKLNTHILGGITDSIVYINQIEKTYREETKEIILKFIASEDYLKLKGTENKFYEYLCYGIIQNKVQSEVYKNVISDIFNRFGEISLSGKIISKEEFINGMINDSCLYAYYNLNIYFDNVEKFKNVILNFKYLELIKLFEILNTTKIINIDISEHMYERINEMVEEEIMNIELSSQLLSIDFTDQSGEVDLFYNLRGIMLSGETELYEEGFDIVFSYLCQSIFEELKTTTESLSPALNFEIIAYDIDSFLETKQFKTEVESVVHSILLPESDYEDLIYEEFREFTQDEHQEQVDLIDWIFDRE